MLGMSERACRDYMADLNERLSVYGKCILSTAARKGYHIPNPFDETDMLLAMQADKELESKAISIFQRRKAIKNFIQFANSAKEARKEVQLSLFDL